MKPTYILLAIFSLCGVVVAQQETASITGQILDPTGGAVAGAAVTVMNEATSASSMLRSDSSGFYRAPNLAPGVYTITIKASGFRALLREGILVRVNDRLRVDSTLEVGQVTEALTVRGETPILQTEDATIGQVVDNKRIVELPLNGRNWLQLALQPLVSRASCRYAEFCS